MQTIDDWKRGGELRMDGYYIGFDKTGVELVDRILSAIAISGKRYHNTDGWNEDHDPPSCVDMIQQAANECADAMRKGG